jgi:hypothetical protein
MCAWRYSVCPSGRKFAAGCLLGRRPLFFVGEGSGVKPAFSKRD